MEILLNGWEGLPLYCSKFSRKQPSHILLGSQELPLSATLDNGIPIKNIIVHPGYEKGGVYHDILIYELENEVR